jgi:hypothetical protein
VTLPSVRQQAAAPSSSLSLSLSLSSEFNETFIEELRLLGRTYVSEEFSASIIRVRGIGELGTTLAVTLQYQI